MKRYGNLYHKVYDVRNIYKAHKEASKGKHHYHEVKMVNDDLEYYMEAIHDMLVNKTYQVSDYEIEYINDNGKEREVHKLPYYPDRIIQWAVLLQTSDIFLRSMTDFTCSSIKGRGGSKATKLLDKYIKKHDAVYCLKFDIKKYYPSINHNILKSMIRRKFKDKNLLWLMDTIIDSFPEKKGVPIGSYTSQYLANFYLSKFDHWLKQSHRIKYVVRYMDDIVIVHKSKKYLHKLFRKIKSYLNEFLELEIKKNWQIFPIHARGIDFVGYRHFSTHKLLRKSIAKRYKKRMMEINNAICTDNLKEPAWRSAQSYKGWTNGCDSFGLRTKYLNPNIYGLDEFYFNNIKRKGR